MAVDGRGCWTSGQPKLNNPSCRGCGCRKRESECLKPPLCVSLPPLQRTSERAREQPAGAPHKQHPPTHHAPTAQPSTAQSTQARACGTAQCSLAPVFPLAAGSPHIACCNPVTDPNPQPSSASHLIHPSHLLSHYSAATCQADTMSDVPAESDFVQIVTFAFRRATLV